ncbi:cell growth-regulating nucleolar protein [Geosmithia morbida]|uniref:Cell growth-regulating nucleolar protein n=1 Tax=Geosmithia morbida TaxID=1094350 RepID=A0A9P5D146_9HYPO|nr:cell growth-regulating nucleolar protein [Geosmithia morbida]KAF4123468.1 cell growth-regulating nucleolar protein [Geosmithia morbida]
MVYFPGTQYRSHTSCMTEEQKYQGSLYKDKNKRLKTHDNPDDATKPTEHSKRGSNMAPHAYVEDADETWKDYQGPTDDERSPANPLPEAPTPPGGDDDGVNVFDFLVATGQTPNASTLGLPGDEHDDGSRSLVPYEYDPEEYLDPASLADREDALGPYETPAAAKNDRRRAKEGDIKTDKKRKRPHPHLEIPRDQIMTDAPPVLHSGLTGGLKGLMRPILPPSPDYSGGDVAEPCPASPLKKTKHSKHHKNGQVSSSIFGMMSAAGKSKSSSKKHKSKKHSSHHRRDKSPKLIEYRPQSKDVKDGKTGEEGQMVVFKPRADVFFDFVNKGPESERGCSMNKTLKRFHRERQAAGSNLAKQVEEKELWRDIRLRRNDRGEIVLFSI